MSAKAKQQLVHSIIDFLQKSIEDGTVKADDKESLEVAIQCIGEAFGVDPADEELSIKPATLQSVFDVFLKTRNKVGGGTQAGSSEASSSKTPSAADKEQAEKFKKDGNSLMSAKNFDAAIEAYNKAVALDPTNPIYYSNRAAAYSSKGDHLAAVGDAEEAIKVDPKFTKAYHRLGHAQYSLGDFHAAASAFERGLKIDPNNAGLQSGLENSQSRIQPEANDTPAQTRSADTGTAPDLASMFGGAGGLPDIGSLMNNPAMMQMAQQMMANGGMERLMANPAVANMMNRVQSGGGMPSMSELLNDPSLRELASSFGAGAGRGDSS